MKQNDREREARSYASRVHRQDQNRAGGWTTSQSRRLHSRGMIPVTALPSRALVRGPGWFRVISGARATFTRPGPSARVPDFSRARAMLRYRLLLARYVRTSVLAFSSSPLPPPPHRDRLHLSRSLGVFCVFWVLRVHHVSSPSLLSPSSLRAPSSLRPSPPLSLSLSFSLSLARSLSSRSPRSFPPTLEDLGDPICRPF